MLKLLVFLACEKSIIDKTEMVSLINVLDGVNVPADGQKELKEDSATPFPWEVFVIWRKTDSIVSNKKFEQKIVLTGTNGKQVFEVVQPLKLDNTHLNYRSQLKVGAMPTGKAGRLSLKIYLRETNPDSRWLEKGEYPIQIIHDKPVQTSAPQRASKKRRK